MAKKKKPTVNNSKKQLATVKIDTNYFKLQDLEALIKSQSLDLLKIHLDQVAKFSALP